MGARRPLANADNPQATQAQDGVVQETGAEAYSCSVRVAHPD
jgi:hypothetical protein